MKKLIPHTTIILHDVENNDKKHYGIPNNIISDLETYLKEKDKNANRYKGSSKEDISE